MAAVRGHQKSPYAENSIEGTIKGIKDAIANSARRRRKSSVSSLLIFFTLIGAAAILAIAWPMHDRSIQPDFFVSLGTTVLTVFGLVFTLCIVGTQIASSLGHVNIRHVFGGWTWVYLSSFLVSALWALAIGYSSEETRPTQQLCSVSFLGKACINQVLAGRLAMFGFIICFLLLLPFMRAIFARISTESIFGRHSRAVATVRSASRLNRHVRQFLNDLELIKDSPESCEQALEMFLAGAARRVTKPPILSKLMVTEAARTVTLTFRDANGLLRNTPSSTATLKPQSKWIAWLFAEYLGRGNKFSPGDVSRKEANAFARLLLDVCESNLRLWRTGQLSSGIVIPSVQSALFISATTSVWSGRLNLARFSDEIAMCIDHVSSEVGTPISNALLRALACTVRYAQSMRESGVESAWAAFEGVLNKLYPEGANGNSVPRWVLYEFHRLLGFSFNHHGIPDSVINILSTIPTADLGSLLRGSVENRNHRDCRRHVELQLIFARRAWSLGAVRQFGVAYKMAVSTAATEDDISTALDCLAILVRAYVQGEHCLTESVADAFMYVTQYINKHPESFKDNQVNANVPSAVNQDLT